MDESEQKAIDDIDEYGCHVLHVMEEENLARFTYSIGIYRKTGKPELVITGLDNEIAHWAINEYNARILNGKKFEVNKFYSGFLEGFDVTFKEVEEKHYDEHFGWGLWYYKDKNFPVLQLIFPTTSGVWPWEKDASEGFKNAQPILCAS